MFYDPKWDKKLKEKLNPEPTDWRDVLNRAADLIEEKGWVRQEFADHGYCTIGAINKVLGRRPSNDDFTGGKNKELARDAVSQLARTVSHTDGHIMAWNNDSGRIMAWNDGVAKDQCQVVAHLRKVANTK